MVLVVYKGSYISVSDWFLFKKTVLFRYRYQFYTGFFPNGNYISLVWELYIFDGLNSTLRYKNDINRYYLKMTPAEFCIAKYQIVIFWYLRFCIGCFDIRDIFLIWYLSISISRFDIFQFWYCLCFSILPMPGRYHIYIQS